MCENNNITKRTTKIECLGKGEYRKKTERAKPETWNVIAAVNRSEKITIVTRVMEERVARAMMFNHFRQEL